VQQLNTLSRSSPEVTGKTASADGEAWLAAAVTATLIEYQRLVQEPGSDGHSTNDTGNWRMVACWERLRS
jgi:hypothetical protein